jgi:DNA-binding PadR family transcriptional regulator
LHDDLLPLKPVETLSLSMLTAGQRHGYGIRQDVLDRRIYYRLSSFGRRVLTADMRRLRELVRLAEDRRLIAPARA